MAGSFSAPFAPRLFLPITGVTFHRPSVQGDSKIQGRIAYKDHEDCQCRSRPAWLAAQTVVPARGCDRPLRATRSGGHHLRRRVRSWRLRLVKVRLSLPEHVRSLSEPDVNLPIHPAPIIQPLVPEPSGRT